ncbi:MAG: EAL domain-containing protein [Candidatus Competibacteraceae bacterium]|nr:EAL domain-containing protein [Candidatus Competibacteraceae bacterium]
MKKNPNPPRGAIKLRHQAEAQLQGQSTQDDRSSPATTVETLRLIHELQVHQIELELQNGELLKMRTQLEQSLEKYADLYDFAPTSYFVLAANGTIQEINLAGAALLGQERSRLLGRRFGLFVSMKTRTAFNTFLAAALTSPSKVRGEVTLTLEGVPPYHLHLEGVSVQFSASPRCRIAAVDITERKHVEERLDHLAYHDALTQLPNRVLLTDRLQQAMAQTLRDQKRLAVCYLDLDGFKAINDTWGHAHGDRVLIEVARRLKSCVRANDTVARLGGDEFILLLGNLTDMEECEQTLNRVVAALHVPFVVLDQPIPLSTSLGVTLYPDDMSNPDTLLRHTDQAMYAAKEAGGNRYYWFDANHDRRARHARDRLQRVKEALAANELRLYYQPKVDMRYSRVIGVEALIRWQHLEEGLLLPERFMPAVDTSEPSIVFGQWVMKETLRQMSVWTTQGLCLPVSINISSRHLQQLDFVAKLRAALAAYPTVSSDGLELEILETVALEDIAAISGLIEDCRQLGVRFALDDFGTGYSSLTYLKNLPVHLLKIDQSFVRDLLVDTDARSIVEGVIGLSVAFRRQVIAEGVETDAQGSLLIRLGCDLAQGYGIAHPMPPEQIPAWIAGWTAPEAWTLQ